VASVTGEFRGFAFLVENGMDSLKEKLINIGKFISEAEKSTPLDEFGTQTISFPEKILPPEKSVKDCTAEDIFRLRKRVEWATREIQSTAFLADRFRAEGKTSLYRRATHYIDGLIVFRKRDKALLQELEWRYAHGLLSEERRRLEKQKDSGQSTEQENRKGRRLKLNRNENEQLNDRIVKKVNELVDSGSATQRQAFEILAEQSQKSKKLFGFALTPKQIEGRFNRNKKKVPD
jgi:hypothetical protein